MYTFNSVLNAINTDRPITRKPSYRWQTRATWKPAKIAKI